eukprot:m.779301 g.779301  ORF g.779301 m.779301 type:complete len:330 (-) comp23278_c0_seq14:2587-3576(-)
MPTTCLQTATRKPCMAATHTHKEPMAAEMRYPRVPRRAPATASVQDPAWSYQASKPRPNSTPPSGLGRTRKFPDFLRHPEVESPAWGPVQPRVSQALEEPHSVPLQGIAMVRPYRASVDHLALDHHAHRQARVDTPTPAHPRTAPLYHRHHQAGLVHDACPRPTPRPPHLHAVDHSMHLDHHHSSHSMGSSILNNNALSNSTKLSNSTTDTNPHNSNSMGTKGRSSGSSTADNPRHSSSRTDNKATTTSIHNSNSTLSNNPETIASNRQGRSNHHTTHHHPQATMGHHSGDISATTNHPVCRDLAKLNAIDSLMHRVNQSCSHTTSNMR